MSRRFLPLAALLFFWLSPTGAEAGDLRFSRAQLEAKWRSRIESLLGQGRVPLIDLQSSIKREDGARHLDDALSVMDKLVIALIAFEGSEDKENRKDSRYDWGYYVHEIVNRYPDRFILAANATGGKPTGKWISRSTAPTGTACSAWGRRPVRPSSSIRRWRTVFWGCWSACSAAIPAPG